MNKFNERISEKVSLIYNMIENEIYEFEVEDNDIATIEGRERIIRGLIDELDYLFNII